MLYFLIVLLSFFDLFFDSGVVCAKAIKPRQYGSEGRFKAWTFYPNSVYHYTGYYMHPTYIEFDNNETVMSISSPRTEGWIWWPVGNRLFLKPVKDFCDTTATVMTSKRVYHFELHAAEAKGPFDTDVPFFIKFNYPTVPSGSSGDGSIMEYMSTDLPDLSHPELYNFNYSVSGDELITPIMIFDDGQFTYLKFRNKSAVFPAVFSVDQEGYEGIVNYRSIGDYIIVENISRVFTLRNGPATVCVFNETLMQKSQNLEALKPSLMRKILQRLGL